MFTASPELLPAVGFFISQATWATYPPSRACSRGTGGDRERHNGALTVLTRNKRAQRNRISAAGHGGIV